MTRNLSNQRQKLERFTLLALLTAIVLVLAYFGGFIRIGGLASVSLTLIPVVLGAALLGPWAGAWLGGVAGAMFFATADAPFWLGLSIHGTIITVMVKGILAGFIAGVVYKLLSKINNYLGAMASAIICPVVNTGVFLLGCLLFFADTIQAGAAQNGQSVFLHLILVYVGLNFVFELLFNVLFVPSLLFLLELRKKAE